MIHLLILWSLSSITYYGDQAVEQLELREGRTLSPAERRVVHEEGFVDGCYADTKGILTCGVGQTGPFQALSFKETFEIHRRRAADRFPAWDTYPEDLRAELVVMEYRGDLGISPKTVALINAGKWLEASKEFLDHSDYTDWSVGVRERLERGSAMLASQA